MSKTKDALKPPQPPAGQHAAASDLETDPGVSAPNSAPTLLPAPSAPPSLAAAAIDDVLLHCRSSLEAALLALHNIPARAAATHSGAWLPAIPEPACFAPVEGVWEGGLSAQLQHIVLLSRALWRYALLYAAILLRASPRPLTELGASSLADARAVLAHVSSLLDLGGGLFAAAAAVTDTPKWPLMAEGVPCGELLAEAGGYNGPYVAPPAVLGFPALPTTPTLLRGAAESGTSDGGGGGGAAAAAAAGWGTEAGGGGGGGAAAAAGREVEAGGQGQVDDAAPLPAPPPAPHPPPAPSAPPPPPPARSAEQKDEATTPAGAAGGGEAAAATTTPAGNDAAAAAAATATTTQADRNDVGSVERQ
eukprot:3362068-Rhodomonas_salina.1